MPRRASDFDRFAKRLCKLRRPAITSSLEGHDLPLFVYSYSSRGFPDLPARYAATRNLAPVHLVSLYDVRYVLDDDVTEPDIAHQGGLRFLDSGAYEAVAPADVWEHDSCVAKSGWSRALYVETAVVSVHPGDILVSFDDYTLSLDEQIRSSWPLFDQISVPDVRRCLLVHPNGASPGELVTGVRTLAPNLDLLGITEKDIAPPWFSAVAYVRQLCRELDVTFNRYVPLHVFGCLDPQTIPLLFFAGADIFDGLAWMRYYFHDRHAYYAKEYEYVLEPAALRNPEEVARSLLEHNVEELERLRADLRYTVLTGDVARFDEHLRILQAFEKVL